MPALPAKIMSGFRNLSYSVPSLSNPPKSHVITVNPPHGHTHSWRSGSDREKTTLPKQTVCPHHKTRKHAQASASKKRIVFCESMWIPYRFSGFHATANIRCTLQYIINDGISYRFEGSSVMNPSVYHVPADSSGGPMTRYRLWWNKLPPMINYKTCVEKS